MYDTLESCPLFSGIGKTDIMKHFSHLFYKIKKYSKGNLIVSSGDECIQLLILLHGTVKAEMMEFSGKTLRIEDITAPKPLATAFLFGSTNRYPVDIIAGTEVEMLVLPLDSVIRLMQSDKRFLRNFLDSVSSRAQFLSAKIRFLSLKTIKGKIAHYFLQLTKDGRDHLILPQTQQELADYFGVARPSLARAMKELAEAGLISIQRKEATIMDRNGLQRFLRNN
ncbi:MAG: Crp/Fnr family transcriptional regulator [Bacteroidetes bacterium]|nr:Crp/Fnr family transcriptional regulator [Bacteroidota bacterium]